MKLFEFNDYNVVVDPSMLMLKPFKALWDRDRSKDKTKAMMELAYVFFMEDSRSDYHIFADEKERGREICAGEGMPSGWKEDKAVKEARAFYSSFKSDSVLLLEDLRAMVANLRLYLKTIDLTEVDDKGKPKYSIDSYTKTVADLNKLILSIDETEKNVNKEIAVSEATRGATEKAALEDL